MVETCTQCGADMHCKRDAVPGYNYCVKHGGPQPRFNFYGVGRKPVTGSGSNSKLVRLASQHITLENDGRYLSNKHTIGMVLFRIEELAQRIEENASPDQVKTLYNLWMQFRELDGKGTTVELVKVKMALDQAFEKVYHDYASWTQMFEAIELARKLRESEVKIAKDLKAVMTAEDGMELVSQLLAIVIQVVNDPVQLKRIIYEFRKLVGDDSADTVEKVAHRRAGGGSGEIIDA